MGESSNNRLGVVVAAQLVERLLPIPEVHGSNPVIGKTLYLTFTVNCIGKKKIKNKEARNGAFLNNRLDIV